jgi:hypothetical protein
VSDGELGGGALLVGREHDRQGSLRSGQRQPAATSATSTEGTSPQSSSSR